MSPDVASELASTIPALAADWAIHAEDLDLPYVAMGRLAARLVELADREGGLNARPLFDDVERRLAVGDAAQRDLLIVGFLEGLQNIERERATRWSQLLGPSTRIAWSSLNDIWAGQIEPETFNQMVKPSRDIPAH